MLFGWLIHLLTLSVSVLIVTYILPSVRVKDFRTAVVVALVYGILKFFFTGIFILLSLPLLILSFGLFYFVINAFLLWITNKFVIGFEIKGFFNILFAAVLISLIETALDLIIPWFLLYINILK